MTLSKCSQSIGFGDIEAWFDSIVLFQMVLNLNLFINLFLSYDTLNRLEKGGDKLYTHGV